jgi:hypothetical protein
MYAFPISLRHSPCPAHRIFLDLIAQLFLQENRELQSCSSQTVNVSVGQADGAAGARMGAVGNARPEGVACS